MNIQRAPATENFRPSWLIEVGECEQLNVRLVETAKFKAEFPVYAALSHPWGKIPMKKMLLTKDIDAMKTNISLRRAPQKLQGRYHSSPWDRG
jgi:hypothetical protein